ncbi:DDE-type integrase/transposase/recombinase [Altererythrobacter fulvus]|uniref:DDE-type integrase/transposase/recombinase n=1 Tax=Caenibius fulvus TaxID=2126012 RepID=UPI003AFA3777
MPTACGISTKWLFASAPSACPCGELSTTKGKPWTYSCRSPEQGRRDETAEKTAKEPKLRAGQDPHRPPCFIPASSCVQSGLALHQPGRLQENNRAENSHLPLRRHERKMQRFQSPEQAQRFASTHCAIYNSFVIQRQLTPERQCQTSDQPLLMCRMPRQ